MDVVRQQAGFASLDMTAQYTHIGIETAKNAVALLPDVTHAADAEDRGEGAAGEKLEAVLAGLEGLSKEDLKKVGERVKEMLGK